MKDIPKYVQPVQVLIPYSNERVFYRNHLTNYRSRINREVEEWLDEQHMVSHQDWGTKLWTETAYMNGERGVEDFQRMIGLKFQFADPKIAILFKLTWA